MHQEFVGIWDDGRLEMGRIPTFATRIQMLDLVGDGNGAAGRAEDGLVFIRDDT